MVEQKYPEHEKLLAVKEESQIIGEFLDDCGYTLCRWTDAGNNGKPRYIFADSGEPATERDYSQCVFKRGTEVIENIEYESWRSGFHPVHMNIEKILAEYFDIDLNKIESEKEEMLTEMRKQNEHLSSNNVQIGRQDKQLGAKAKK